MRPARQHHLEHQPADRERLLAAGEDLGGLRQRVVAGGDDALPAAVVHLDAADAARRRRLDQLAVAQRRDGDPGLRRGLEDRGARLDLGLLAVDGDLDHVACSAHRLTRTGDRVELAGVHAGAALDALRPGRSRAAA